MVAEMQNYRKTVFKYPTPKNVEDDKKFRDDIVANVKDAVDFFLGDYSIPILNGIGRSMHRSIPFFVGSSNISIDNQEYLDDEEIIVNDNDINYYVALSGPYYEFISKPYNNGKPEWIVLSQYNGDKNARLHNYIIRAFTRYIFKEYMKISKNKGIVRPPKSGINTVEAESYLFNILMDTLYDEEVDFITEEIVGEIKSALGLFGQTKKNEDYMKIINLSIFEEHTTDEIAETLGEWFAKPLKDLSRKDIQTRISQWKQRAIKQFAKFILDSNNEKNFQNLWSYVSEHINKK